MRLEHTVVASGTPTRAMLFLHGMLGRGTNWQTFARRFVERRPTWAAVLVDLRLHGRSRTVASSQVTSHHTVSPNTVAAAAADLTPLADTLPWPVQGVVGHSFGGKVALAWLGQVTGADSALPRPSEAWIIDAPPGARASGEGDDAIRHVLDTLRTCKGPWRSRNEFVEALAAAGIGRQTGLWLAQNLEREQGQLVLALDLQSIGELLEDHFATDLWPVVDAMQQHVALHFVVGGRSTVFTPREREKAEHYATAGKITLHVLKDAGHWVHAEDPEGLLRVMTA